MSFPHECHVLPSSSNVTFKDVVGLEDAKEVLHRKIITPIRNKNLYDESGIKHPVAIFIHGPRECGKTYLMKAVGNETGTKISTLTKDEMVLIGYGEERNFFKDLFQRAVNYGTSTIIYISSLVLITKNRKMITEHKGPTLTDLIKKRGIDVLNCLLEEMNRASESTDVYVVIASSNPTVNYEVFFCVRFLSTALYIGTPEKKTGLKIIKQYAKEKLIEFACDVDLNEIASQCNNYSYLDWCRFIRKAREYAIRNNLFNIILKERFIIALTKIRPKLFSGDKRFEEMQSQLENFLKNAARIKSDVLAKSYSTLR